MPAYQLDQFLPDVDPSCLSISTVLTSSRTGPGCIERARPPHLFIVKVQVLDIRDHVGDGRIRINASGFRWSRAI